MILSQDVYELQSQYVILLAWCGAKPSVGEPNSSGSV